MNCAFLLFALFAQASAAMSKSEVLGKANEVATRMVALQYIKNGVESDVETNIIAKKMQELHKQKVEIEGEASKLGGKIDFNSLLKKAIAKSRQVDVLVQDEEKDHTAQFLQELQKQEGL